MVDVADQGRIPADFCGYIPEVSETVWVLFVGGTALILGPTVLKGDSGTVASAPSANLVAVATDGGTITVPYASGLTLSIGQRVKLGSWSGGGFVYAVISTTPVPNTPPVTPVPSGGTFSQTFLARDSGSYRSGWWTNDVWASDNNTGAWFHGSAIADTIPDSAAILDIKLYMSPSQAYGYAPNIGYHGSPTKPGGNISPGGTSAIGVSSGWVSIPASIGDYLKTTPGGIAVNHGGYNIFRSIQSDASSGALSITWRT